MLIKVLQAFTWKYKKQNKKNKEQKIKKKQGKKKRKRPQKENESIEDAVLFKSEGIKTLKAKMCKKMELMNQAERIKIK